jgi:hypothetical protein
MSILPDHLGRRLTFGMNNAMNRGADHGVLIHRFCIIELAIEGARQNTAFLIIVHVPGHNFCIHITAVVEFDALL